MFRKDEGKKTGGVSAPAAPPVPISPWPTLEQLVPMGTAIPKAPTPGALADDPSRGSVW